MTDPDARYTILVFDEHDVLRERHDHCTEETTLWLVPNLIKAGLALSWDVVVRRVKKIL